MIIIKDYIIAYIYIIHYIYLRYIVHNSIKYVIDIIKSIIDTI